MEKDNKYKYLIYNGNTAHTFLPNNLKLLDYEESEDDPKFWLCRKKCNKWDWTLC